MLRIWHNPRCSKSRATLALLEARGLKPEVFLYLITPPDAEMLTTTLAKLGKYAAEVVRMGQTEWKATGLNADSPEDAVLNAMLAEPILIERPIVETADAARIGRPPETVLEIL
jgi:arsenate reductase